MVVLVGLNTACCVLCVSVRDARETAKKETLLKNITLGMMWEFGRLEGYSKLFYVNN